MDKEQMNFEEEAIQEKPARSRKKTEADKKWGEMRTIQLPKASKSEQNFQFVAVNGRTFQVPKGKPVEVPRPVYEVLMNSLYAEEKADEYENQLQRTE